MTENKQCFLSDLIFRAYTLIRKSKNMAFVGIYSTETYELLASADRENAQINSDLVDDDNQNWKMDVEIYPSQIQAIVRHIRTPDNPLTQINIANLRFVCLRTGSGCMTGMSNFNMGTERDSVNVIDKSVFNIIHKHYTSQELLEGVHALQISAILKDEFIIVGMCRAGRESSLKILKTVFEEPENLDTDVFETHSDETENMVMNSGKPEVVVSTDSSENGKCEQDPLLKPEVELRRSTLPPEERQRLREKRETSFCEDWRAATSKSIDALRLIGPFRSEDDFSDRDDRPLIENIESIDMCPAENVSVASEKESKDSQRDPKSKDARVVRRPSRATMV